MKRFVLLIVLCVASLICRASDWHVWEGNASLPKTDVYALAFDADGRLLIGTEQGLYAADGKGKIIGIPLTDGGTRQPTVNRIEIRDGHIYIGTLTGTYMLEGNSATLCDTIMARDYIQSDLPASLQDKIVKDAAALSHGWKAYATNSDGIYLYRRSTGSVINMRRRLEDPASIPGNHVSSVAYDHHSGRLYASIYHSGIYFTEPDLSAIETVRTGIEENISSFAIDGKGRLWTAYDGAGIAVGQDTVLTDLPSRTVTNLLPMSDGNVLAASYGGGVFMVDTMLRAMPVAGLGAGSPASRSRGMAVDAFGKLWVATFSDGVVRHDLKAGTSDKFNISNSALKTDYITDLCKSPRGDSIFVATHYGVFAFDARSGLSTEIRTPFAGNDRIAVDQLAFDGKGNLYLATAHGLADRYGRCVVLEGTPLIALKGAGDGTLWCSSDSAVYHVDVSCNPPRVETFANLDGLRFGKYALYDTGDGTVLAGAFGAVAVISSDLADAPNKKPADNGSSVLGWRIFIIVIVVLAIGLLLFTFHRRVRKKKQIETVVPPQIGQQDSVIDDKGRSTDVTVIAEASSEADNHNDSETDADRSWLQSIDSIIDANISDADFSIEDLGRHAGMSRSNLYKRIKAITGLSPLEYLRDRRVAKGRQLLAQATGKHVRPTLSEIAYQVGMSPRQFSKYLRQ